MDLGPPDRMNVTPTVPNQFPEFIQPLHRLSAIGHRLLIVLALYLFWFSPSLAGDYSQPGEMGYSSDFRFLTFEEFGIEDGSGFPYSNYYLIDLKAGPAKVIERVQANFDGEDNPTAQDLFRVRAQAREKSQAWMNADRALWPAQMLAHNGDGVPDDYELKSGKGLILRFGPTGYNGAVTGDYSLSLSFTEIQTNDTCADWGPSQPVGFALTLTNNDNDQSSEVFRTNGLLEENTCPYGFTISGVYMPFEANDISDAFALISVLSRGFEGFDRRFLVVSIAP